MTSGPRVALVDSGGTNIGSVAYALERLGASARLTADPATIRAADRVILPGVGAAGPGMARLLRAGLVDVLAGLAQPLLGVCLGMQLLFESSAESTGASSAEVDPDSGGQARRVECLGLLPGEVVPIPAGPGVRVPHMGWNTLDPLRDDPLTRGISPGDRAYFVHSYGVPVTETTVMSSTHGTPWSAVVSDGRRWGAQFHPERSGGVGARLLRNFMVEVA